MFTIICATNRPGNLTQYFCKDLATIYAEKGQPTAIFFLRDLPIDVGIRNPVYGKEAPELESLLNKYILPATHLHLVVPEYNGSFPGLLKVFIDSISPKIWKEKKIALTGTAIGRSGNLRGLDSLTNIFNYLQAEVLPLKTPISLIDTLMNPEKDKITDLATLQTLAHQVNKFIQF